MGQHAVGTVLCPVGQVFKIPAAVVSKKVKWAVAEKAVEILNVFIFMAGEILALFVSEKFTAVFHISTSFMPRSQYR